MKKPKIKRIFSNFEEHEIKNPASIEGGSRSGAITGNNNDFVPDASGPMM